MRGELVCKILSKEAHRMNLNEDSSDMLKTSSLQYNPFEAVEFFVIKQKDVDAAAKVL